MNLKELVFSRAKAELDAYRDMEQDGGYTDEEKKLQRQRFCSVYQIFEEAGLENEYEHWKEDKMVKRFKELLEETADQSDIEEKYELPARRGDL